MERAKFTIAAIVMASAFVTACGPDEASRGGPPPQQGPAGMAGAEPSPGTKGPGPVDRGRGQGEGRTVGESQNRDTKTGGATSGAK
jgi:hypothetical protein